MKTKEELRYELVKEWLPSILDTFTKIGEPLDGKTVVRQTIMMADYTIEKLSSSTKERKTSDLKPFSDRLSDFRREVDTFFKIYPKSMLDSFFNYWSEPNKTQTKMRWEGEKTWEIGRRLTAWASRSGVKPMEAPKVDNEYLAFKRKYEKA